MLDHDLGATNSWHYNSLSVPVRFHGDPGIWTAFMFVDDATAMIAGRELVGESKKWADMDWRRDDVSALFDLGLLGEQSLGVREARRAAGRVGGGGRRGACRRESRS